MKTKLPTPFRCLAAASGLILSLNVSAAPLTWFPGPTLDSPMSGAMAVLSGGNNVVVGGDAYEYDFYPVTYPLSLGATNTYWNYLYPYDNLNIAGGAVISDGNAVIFGGTDGTNSQSLTIDYSLSGDTTPVLNAMNVERSYLGYAPDRNGNAYAFGGLDASGNPLASAEKLNPTANSAGWAYIASLPVARYNFPAVFNRTNYIYVFGGQSDPVAGTEIASVLRYSVSGNSWSNMAPMPVAVAGSAAALGPDGKIYVAGGTCGGISTNVVQVYTPGANSWAVSTPLPEGLSQATMSVDSLGRLIVIGGLDTNGNDVSDVWRSQLLAAPDSAPVLTQMPGSTNAVYLGVYTSFISAMGNPQPTYQLLNGPAGMTVDTYSGAITWTPTGLSQIGSNSVTVSAANFAGATNWNFTINVPNPPPTSVTNLNVVGVSEFSVTLSWSPEDAAAGPVTYAVYLRHFTHDPKGSGGTVSYSKIGGNTAQTSLTISGLTPGLSQAYYVVAFGSGGSSGYNSAVVATTLSEPAPTNLVVTGLTSKTITLAWDAPVGSVPVASYEIWGWYDGIATQYPLEYLNILTTAATITNVPTGTPFLWCVRAHDIYENISAFDYLPSLVVNPVPAAPQIGTVSNGGGNFQLTASEGGSAIQTVLIQASTNPADPASWRQIGSLLPATNPFTFTDTNAAQFPMRFYRMVAP